jgi:hypothetical protein
MAKRKTSCGNARMCSMLLTNVTRSASYEALPNHWLFPARSGLTSRFPLRNRCLWHLRSNKSGDAVGRPSCRSSLLGDPGAKFLVETGDPSRTMKNSLNYVSTCLRVVDTRRPVTMLWTAPHAIHFKRISNFGTRDKSDIPV